MPDIKWLEPRLTLRRNNDQQACRKIIAIGKSWLPFASYNLWSLFTPAVGQEHWHCHMNRDYAKVRVKKTWSNIPRTRQNIMSPAAAVPVSSGACFVRAIALPTPRSSLPCP